MHQNFLNNKIYSSIYARYSVALKAIYSGKRLTIDTQKHAYLQELQETDRQLRSSYLIREKPTHKRYVEVDYSKLHFQEVYLLRYFFPHALFIPSVIHLLLQMQDFSDIVRGIIQDNKLLKASFFGCGPCPEFYGLQHYLQMTQSNIAISATTFDTIPWTWKCNIPVSQQFSTDLAGVGNDFLDSNSENCVMNSDLVTVQCCLNEIPVSSCPQLLINLMYLINMMKPGALALIIERHGYIEPLLDNFLTRLTKEFDNIQIRHNVKSECDPLALFLTRLNCEHVPLEIQSIMQLARSVRYRCLAISKK